MIKNGQKVAGSRALILGITFKENCPDIRNSRVIAIYTALTDFSLEVDIFDPHADDQEVYREYGIELQEEISGTYNSIILAVSHEEFREFNFKDLRKSESSVVFDIKSFLDRSLIDGRL